MRKLTVVLAALLAACGTEGERGTRLDSAPGEVAAAGVLGSFVVTLNEWKIELPMDSLPAGRYTFRVENAGSTEHALEIEGNGDEWETGDLKPGTSSELTVDLKPGTYEVYCPVEKGDDEHEERGMKRTLVVRAG